MNKGQNSLHFENDGPGDYSGEICTDCIPPYVDWYQWDGKATYQDVAAEIEKILNYQVVLDDINEIGNGHVSAVIRRKPEQEINAPKRILILDDDKTWLNLIAGSTRLWFGLGSLTKNVYKEISVEAINERLVRTHGKLQIFAPKNLVEAIQLTEQYLFDLVILDLNFQHAWKLYNHLSYWGLVAEFIFTFPFQLQLEQQQKQMELRSEYEKMETLDQIIGLINKSSCTTLIFETCLERSARLKEALQKLLSAT